MSAAVGSDDLKPCPFCGGDARATSNGTVLCERCEFALTPERWSLRWYYGASRGGKTTAGHWGTVDTEAIRRVAEEMERNCRPDWHVRTLHFEGESRENAFGCFCSMAAALRKAVGE